MLTTILSSFKNYLYQVGYSATTQYMLPACVQEFVEQQGVTDISCVEQAKVKNFYAYLHTRPLKKRAGALSEMMISHYVYALKTFFTWAELTGQLDYNPISGLKFKRPEQHSREPLSKEAIQQLFAATTTLQEIALLHVFYSCGLRRSEGEALNIQDVHFNDHLLYVPEGKGARRRVVPLTGTVSSELEQYYVQERRSRTAKNATDRNAFLLNRVGSRMSGDQCNQAFKQLAAKAGLPAECSLHHLRHSIATHLLQGGMRLEQVRDFLGHSYLETTQLYAKPTTEQLKLL